MKKQVFQLKDEFCQSFDSPDDIIVWTYRNNGKTLYSMAYNELIVANFVNDFETLYLN